MDSQSESKADRQVRSWVTMCPESWSCFSGRSNEKTNKDVMYWRSETVADLHWDDTTVPLCHRVETRNIRDDRSLDSSLIERSGQERRQEVSNISWVNVWQRRGNTSRVTQTNTHTWTVADACTRWWKRQHDDTITPPTYMREVQNRACVFVLFFHRNVTHLQNVLDLVSFTHGGANCTSVVLPVM